MRKIICLLSLITILTGGCIRHNLLKQGPYLGVLRIDSTEHEMDLPFNMIYAITPDGQKIMQVSNANEIIMISELAFSGDTVFMKFPVFTSEIIALIRHDSLIGRYYPKGKEAGRWYTFYALPGVTDRFPWSTQEAGANVTGRWKINENAGTPDSSVMIGEFVQESNRVTGTILNTGGDYRYLEGKVSGNKFMISAIDGAHTLILTAGISKQGKLENGRFMGSPNWKSSWTAEKNETITLPKMDELVKLKPNARPFTFELPDINGDKVSLADPKFKDKVVVVMAIGTWCPNCLDETIFFREMYTNYRDKGLELVALCFEDKTMEDSKPRIERFIAQTGAGYTFLYAGPRGRESVQSVLFNMDGRLAYPTTLFIDRKGVIRKVETGFSGPGTGRHYEEFCKETTKFIETLLEEKP
ncbi:MAG: TlpA disulfide reductase family protein [Bacteroidetes bacterium]|nr:TlpA disulfide reductase family protein [Bacteroidota bacterium]